MITKKQAVKKLGKRAGVAVWITPADERLLKELQQKFNLPTLGTAKVLSVVIGRAAAAEGIKVA